MSGKLSEEIAAPITHTSEQFLDLLHSQRRWSGAAVFPSVDGREGHAELGREFFLGEPGSFPKLTDQSGNVCLTIQCIAPFRSEKGLNKSEFITRDMSDDISYAKRLYCQIVFTLPKVVLG
jgi:hypothetical protein